MTDPRSTAPIWQQVWRRLQGAELAFLGGVAAIVGLFTGLGVSAFHWLIHNGVIGVSSHVVMRLAWGQRWVLPLSGAGAPWWAYALVLGVPIAGLLVAAGLVRRLAKDEYAPGVPGIMEAVALRGGRLRVRPALARIGAAVFTIVSGGSVGVVDPSVQIGATLASWLGQRLRFSDRRIKTLVACGAAGGVASAFNAPIAGVFFAQEIILGEFSTTAFGMVVLSAVTASVVSRVLQGESPAFRIPEVALRTPWELLFYLLLGLLAGVLSAAYARGLLRFEMLARRWRVPFPIEPLLGGLIVGAVGLAFPQILGVGYETMDALLQGDRLAWGLLLALILLKPLLTSITLAAGGSGGLFSPSLFVGAMLGEAFGQLANWLTPGLVAPTPAYALVGMGAVLAGAVHAPITAILLLFEMTRDYRIILPIMLSAVVSTLISQWLSPHSVYTERMARRGLHIHQGRDLDVMDMVSVGEAMTEDFDLVRPEMTLGELGRVLEESHHHGFPVVDTAGNLRGVVTLSDYHQALVVGEEDQTVADICTCDPVVVYADQSLGQAMHLLAAYDVGRLPVVRREDARRIVGLLRRYDVIRAYNKGLARRAQIERQVREMRVASYRGGELLTLELPAEAAAVGHWIRDLHLPEGTIVVSVQRGERGIIPRGGTRLEAGDYLVLAVEDEAGERRVRQILLEGKGLPRGRETRYGKYRLPADAPSAGRRIVDLGLPRDSLVVSVKRAGRTMVAHGGTVLQAGDEVVVFAEEEDLGAVAHCLLGGMPSPGPEYALKNVLVLVDGSDYGWLALKQALELVGPVGGTIHGLFVIEEALLKQPERYLPMEERKVAVGMAGRPEELEALFRGWGEQVMAELQRCCQERGVSSFATIQRGAPVDVVDQLDVTEDLIVLPYRGQYVGAEPGSTVTRMVGRVDVPVLVAVGPPRAVRRLLVLYEGGAVAERALHLAGRVALALEAPLDVLVVAAGEVEAAGLLERAGALLRAQGVAATSLWRTGETVGQLLSGARERDSDLIVLGVYGQGYLRRGLAGGTLDELLPQVGVPVMAVGAG